MTDNSINNQEKNKVHYERLYAGYNVENIITWLGNLDHFLRSARAVETSWNALYRNDLKNRLEGKKVLEMGCGDCVNAAIMAGLGAEVYANDIADASGLIIEKLNSRVNFEHPIKFISGDFLKNNLEAKQFDFIIGKAFLHHLTIPEEQQFLRETARLLKATGEARFFEPAVNSKLLDEIRWMIPLKGRPSKLQKSKFREWKKNDPHPERSFSSRHYQKAGSRFFYKIEIIPVGILERFSRLFSWGERRNRFKRWAFRNEILLPQCIQKAGARSQLIKYQFPIND